MNVWIPPHDGGQKKREGLQCDGALVKGLPLVQSAEEAAGSVKLGVKDAERHMPQSNLKGIREIFQM